MIKIRFFALLMAGVLLASCATTGGEGNPVHKASAHYKLGVAYLNENKIQQAFVEFHKATELDPSNKEVLNAIGYLYLMHLDQTEKALEYFEKAAKIDPAFSDAYNNLGYAYDKLGNFETAILFYRKALANPIYPTADKAYFNMGNAYYRLGRYDQAVSSFKEAVRRNPDVSVSYMRLALCYNAMGRYGDASAAMTHAINLDPLYRGNREKAVEDLTLKKLRATGYEEKDIRDYLEILKY